MIDKPQNVKTLGPTKVKKVQALDLNTMRPMERYQYITGNYKVCPCCKKEKRFTSFWDKVKNIILDNCTMCNKKLYELEVLKIVLGVLTKDGVK